MHNRTDIGMIAIYSILLFTQQSIGNCNQIDRYIMTNETQKLNFVEQKIFRSNTG